MSKEQTVDNDQAAEDMFQLGCSWKDGLSASLPTTELGWFKIFPEAKPLIKQRLKGFREEQRALLKQKLEFNQLIGQGPYSQWWFKSVADELFEKHRKALEQNIQRYTWALHTEEQKQLAASKNISHQELDQAKAVSIEFLYGGNLKQTTGRKIGLCPFHKEKTPSFTIYTQQNTYWCFGCSDGSDSIGFIMKRDGVNFIQAVKILIGK